MIAVLDYGAGNLTSVALAVRHVGHEPHITRDPDELRRADRIIYPGVGAAGSAMEGLSSLGLDDALRDALSAGKPVLAICIGCQVIFSSSEEDGGTSCLDILGGRVERFRFPEGVERKVPHMGWNEVEFLADHELFRGVPRGSQFYFVHSYHVRPDDTERICGVATYGDVRFVAAIEHGNMVALQFHTEKSGPPGLKILENFLGWNP